MSSDAHNTHVQGLAEIFLRDILHADRVAHGNRNLWIHLQKTQRLLISWHQPRRVHLAGLFHSIYGTSQFTTNVLPLECRRVVQDLIGKEAELLAYLFCVADRTKFPWADAAFLCLQQDPPGLARELYTIEAANLIEQGEPAIYAARLKPWLEGAAYEAVEHYHGPAYKEAQAR